MHAQLGGPVVEMKTGRRDSRESHVKELEDSIPNHNDSMSLVLSRFQSIGLDVEAIVALLGIFPPHTYLRTSPFYNTCIVIKHYSAGAAVVVVDIYRWSLGGKSSLQESGAQTIPHSGPYTEPRSC